MRIRLYRFRIGALVLSLLSHEQQPPPLRPIEPEQMTAEKQKTLDNMYAAAKRSFPGVPEITAADLMAKLEAGAELVLVDVRQPQEQAVSMLPGAITAETFQQNAEQYEGKTVVPYCTIGGRSGMYAMKLKTKGWDVLNFAGSVLAWSLAGGDFECEGEATNRVYVNAQKYALVRDEHEAVF